MHFLRPSSCGDGIKALLSLFDFQHPPITAGHWLIIVPLQSLGMALLTPPTPELPLKAMVTSSCRTQELWNICCKKADLPSDFLSCWISAVFSHMRQETKGGEQSWRKHFDITDTWIAYHQCMNRFRLFLWFYWTWRMQSIRGECWLSFIGFTPCLPNPFGLHPSIPVLITTSLVKRSFDESYLLLDLKPNFSGPPPSSMSAGPDAYLQGNIRMTLEDPDLWKTFHGIGTEMIITKPGR